jgi:Flp pilus assembly protein TadG
MRGRGPAREHGAAAVEFALVVPLLLAVMFGIIDYGLWFSDSLSVRQGVDEGARAAVVNDFGRCTTGSAAARTACVVKDRISANGGTAYVRVVVTGPATSSGPGAADDWTKGGQLLVCGVVKETGLTGLTPMPKDGLITSTVTKRVEVTNAPATVPAYADTLPSGATWDWCT